MWIWIRLNSLEAVIVICMLESTDKAFGLRCPCPTHMGHGTCIGHSCTRPNWFLFLFFEKWWIRQGHIETQLGQVLAKKTKRAENLKHTVTLSTDLLPLLLLLTEIGPTLLQFPPSALFPCSSMCDLSLFCLPHTITNTWSIFLHPLMWIASFQTCLL